MLQLDSNWMSEHHLLHKSVYWVKDLSIFNFCPFYHWNPFKIVLCRSVQELFQSVGALKWRGKKGIYF